MPTTISSSQMIDNLFLLKMLSSPHAEQSRLLQKVLETVKNKPENDFSIEVRVNGVECDFTDFTTEVSRQFDEIVMNAARKLLDSQFGDRFREISYKLNDAEQHAKMLCDAMEDEARKAWGMDAKTPED